MKIYTNVIESPLYKNQKKKADRLKKQATAFDAALSKERDTWFTKPAVPMLVRFIRDQSKLPKDIAVELPHDTAIAAIHRGRATALPVASFDVMPDLVVDEDNLEHAGLNFAVT